MKRVTLFSENADDVGFAATRASEKGLIGSEKEKRLEFSFFSDFTKDKNTLEFEQKRDFFEQKMMDSKLLLILFFVSQNCRSFYFRKLKKKKKTLLLKFCTFFFFFETK